MKYFPIFINLNDRNVLVVGGGDVATRKVRLLAKAAGQVIVVAPNVTASLMELSEASSEVNLVTQSYDSTFLDNIDLVVAATNDESVNRQVYQDAESRGIPVNVVDHPDLCRFIMPSIIDRSPLLVAITSNGLAPVLLRQLRTRLESLIPSSYGRLAQWSGNLRDKVKQAIHGGSDRRRFWEEVFEGEIAELVHQGNESAAEKLFQQKLVDASNSPTNKKGEVYLVGAGPGDPDLLTFRAIRLMQKADVVLHDRLVSQEVLELVRRDAELIYVGKKMDNHTLPQDEINHLLIKLAKEGKRVVRLKGGDPFIFGRGGEEIETLMQENILFEVVPGITSASGSACYSGIPLTHRDYAQSVLFTTGHLKDNTVNLNWPALVQKNQTIVIYMGLIGLGIIAENLIKNGMSKDMPVAVIQSATTQKQKVVDGTLSNIDDLVQKSKLKSPAMVIIGDVVRLRPKLNWFRKSND